MCVVQPHQCRHDHTWTYVNIPGHNWTYLDSISRTVCSCFVQTIAAAFASCASMAPAWKQRADLRNQLFSGEAKNTPGKKLDEDDWLVPNWSVYIKLNFELPDPGHDKAVAELRKMVADRETPDYKGGKKGGRAKPIPPRPLGDLELAKLQELLPTYEACQKNVEIRAIERPRWRHGVLRSPDGGPRRLCLRGINIQEQWAQRIYAGLKTIEARKYPLKRYKDELLWLIETPDKPNSGKRRRTEITGVVRFGNDVP